MLHGYREMLVELCSWRIATALAKRHPNLITIFIGHPGGGMSDVLWLKDRTNRYEKAGILLNRTGSIHVDGRFDGNPKKGDFLMRRWEQYISHDHQLFIRKLEKFAGLPNVQKSPITTNRILVYQTLCFILSHAYISNGPAAPLDWRYTVRNGYFDSSGYSGSGENPDLDKFSFDKELFRKQDGDLFDNPYYRFWLIYEHDLIQDTRELKLGFEESSGTMLAPDGGKQFDLMKIYNSQGRNSEGFQHLLEQDLYCYLRGFGAVA